MEKKIFINNLDNLDNYGKDIITNNEFCIGFYNSDNSNPFWFKLNNNSKNKNNYSCFGYYYGSSTCLESINISLIDHLERRTYTDLNILVKHNDIELLNLNFTPLQIENYIGDNGIKTYYNKKKIYSDDNFEIGFKTRDLHRFPNHPVEISGCWINIIS